VWVRNGLFAPLFIRSLGCCPVSETHSSRLEVIAVRDRGDFSVLLLTREPDFKVIAYTSREAYISTKSVSRRRRTGTGKEEEKNHKEEEKDVRQEGEEVEEEEEEEVEKEEEVEEEVEEEGDRE
jgi:hypothetical protein